MSTRSGLILILAALSTLATGCRTAGVGTFARPESIAKPASLNPTELLVEHNKNAELIQSYTARPSIKVQSGVRSLTVDGKLALERPRNFKLSLAMSMQEVADIGSNDQEYWFWIKPFEKRAKRAVYYCNYDENGESPLAGGIQPEWIVEALGLRAIPEAEAREMTAKRGRDRDTIVLTHVPSESSGKGSYVRKIVMQESTRRIKEVHLYTPDQKTELAWGVIADYRGLPSDPGDEASETVYVPTSVQLAWVRERMSMTAVFDRPKVNESFNGGRREALFVEPKMAGFPRVNLLDELGRGRAGLASGANSRGTLRNKDGKEPAVQLGAPSSIVNEDARGASPSGGDFSATKAALDEVIVGARLPSPPEPDAVRAGTAYADSLNTLGTPR